MRRIIKKLITGFQAGKTCGPRTDYINKMSNTEFWTAHTVTGRKEFSSREDSLDYLDWRNAQYLFYEDLLPVRGYDGKVILDYGCGPGNDLVGFLEYSKPEKIIGADISAGALEDAQKRLLWHKSDKIELKLLKDGDSHLPFENSFFDYVHSSGVLHHTPNIETVLKEFFRILKPGGLIRIMVYNYYSIWLHLYVAYQRRLIRKIDADVSLSEAFKRSTDGEACPISRCYKPPDFLELCERAGFKAKFLDAAISLQEMTLLPLRYEAMQNIALDKEHRDFLKELTFDMFGRPIYRQAVAGIDGCYELTK